MSKKLLLCARQHKINIPFGVIQTNGLDIIDINEKPDICNYVNAGIYMIDKSIIKLIPKNKYLDMPDLLLLTKNLDKSNSLSHTLVLA